MAKEFLKAKESNKKYFPIAKKVNHIDLQKIKKLPIFIHGQNKGGLIIEKRTNRQKPYGILASRTIGILRDENPVGIERSFNKNLSGTNGIQLKQNIGKNRWISKKSEANMNPVAGNDVVTTINIDFQDVVENALAHGIIDNNASWGCAVVMEVTTGRVKAIANLHYDTINNQLDEIIKNNKVVLFMKGTPDAPQCGFSMAVSNILKILEVNYKGTINVVKAAHKAGVKRIVIVSSNSPFGGNECSRSKFDEASNYNPYMGYGQSKYLMEKYQFLQLSMNNPF